MAFTSYSKARPASGKGSKKPSRMKMIMLKREEEARRNLQVLSEEEKQKSSDKTGASVGTTAGAIAALIAISIEDCASLKSLSSSGAILNEVDAQGNSLIHHACETGDVEMVQAIINHYKDEPSYLDEPNLAGQTALFVAARVGNPRIVQRLLEAKCDPTRRDKTGFTTLHCSAFIGNLEISKMLMERGCDAFTYDKIQQSPANIIEKSWDRPHREISDINNLVKKAFEDQPPKMLADPYFQKAFLADHLPILRKHFSKSTFNLTQLVEEALEEEQEMDQESEEEEEEEDGDTPRSDAEEDEDGVGEEEEEEGGENGSIEDGTDVVAGEDGIKEDTIEPGDDELAEGAIGEEGRPEDDEDFIKYPDLLDAFEVLKDDIHHHSRRIVKTLTAERDKFGVLRDLILPGWREGVADGRKKKKKVKAKENRKSQMRKSMMMDTPPDVEAEEAAAKFDEDSVVTQPIPTTEEAP